MKLSDIGTLLNTNFGGLELAWQKLVRMNLDIPPFIMRIYAKFLLDVIHDRETASEIIRKLQILNQQNQQKGRTCNNPNEFSDEQTGLLSISGEDVSKSSYIGLFMDNSYFFSPSPPNYLKQRLIIFNPSPPDVVWKNNRYQYGCRTDFWVQ